jgi:hypothetical protein
MNDLRDLFSLQDVEGALQEAIAQARSGEKDEARFVLQQIVEAEPHNELAWFWLAWCATSKAERIEALQQVVEINPANARARRILDSLQEPIWGPLWELRHHRYTRPVAIGAIALVLLAIILPLGLRAYRTSYRRSLESAVVTSEALKVKAMQTATAGSWVVPTWTAEPTPTRTPSPTNTLVVPQELAPGSSASDSESTPTPIPH